MQEIVDLQRKIWGYGNPGSEDPYPARALFSFSESGGQVVTALVDGQTAGFSAAWMGREKTSGDWYLHSQLVGVLPPFRSLRVGFLLKQQQREFALQQGLKKVRWTFDPAQSVNAGLNLRKLGAIIETYRPHYYGSIRSSLNTGGESDRVWAEWYVGTTHVRSRLSSDCRPPDYSSLPRITRCRLEAGGGKEFPVLHDFDLSCREMEFLVELPGDFPSLSRLNPQPTVVWRQGLRSIFLHYLSEGYRVDDFWTAPGKAGIAGCYHFTRRPLHEILEP